MESVVDSVIGGFTESDFLEWEMEIADTLETEFSLAPASRVKRSDLPVGAFLIVGDKNNKSTWHLSFKDLTGKVNVGFLRAARQVVKNRKFRGQPITFGIPQTVTDKVNRLWDEWQKKKPALSAASMVREGEFEGYLTESEVDGSMSLSNKIKKKRKIQNFVNCDSLALVDDVFEGVKFEDESKTIKGVTIMTEGWSRNDHGYPKQYLESLITRLSERPKMFSGHEVKDKLRRIDRPMHEWVSMATNPRVEVAASGKYKGKHQVKADLVFTEFDIGKQTYAQAKKDPSSVRISINARNLMNPEGDFEGRKGEVMEECLFLYSPDFVSYDAAGGGIDVANSNLEGMSIEEKVLAQGWGDYQIYETATGIGEGSTSRFASILESNVVAIIEEAFQSLQDRLKGQEVREKFFDITRFFNGILREIVMDRDNAYPTNDAKKGAFDVAVTQLKEVMFGLNLDDLKNQINSDTSENQNRKEVKSMAKYEFESESEAFEDDNIRKAAMTELKLDDPKGEQGQITLESLIALARATLKENKELTEKVEKAEAEELKRKRLDKFNALVGKEKYNILAEFITEDFRAACLAALTDDAMESLVRKHKEFLDGILKKATNLKTGNTVNSQEREYIESIVESSKNSDSESTEDFWKRLGRE